MSPKCRTKFARRWGPRMFAAPRRTPTHTEVEAVTLLIRMAVMNGMRMSDAPAGQIHKGSWKKGVLCFFFSFLNAVISKDKVRKLFVYESPSSASCISFKCSKSPGRSGKRGLRGPLGETLGLQLKKQILLCNQELSKVCLLTAAYFGMNILDGT